MKRIFLILAVLSTVTLATSSCTKDNEESGTQLDINETHDEMQNGIRLVLSFHPGKDSFIGKVENNTIDTIQNIRVEIQLSNGTILEQIISVELAPKETKAISVSADGQIFVSWSASLLTEVE